MRTQGFGEAVAALTDIFSNQSRQRASGRGAEVTVSTAPRLQAISWPAEAKKHQRGAKCPPRPTYCVQQERPSITRNLMSGFVSKAECIYNAGSILCT